MALNVGKIVALFEGDAKSYFATSKKVRADAVDLDGKRVTPEIDGDAAPLDRVLARAKANLQAFAGKGAVAQIDADISRAQARIREMESRRGEVGIDVDAEIAKAEATIEALTSRRRNLTIGVDPDTGGAFRAGVAMGTAAKAGIASVGVASALGVGGGLIAGAGPAILGVGTAAGITAGLVSTLSKAVKAYTADQKAAETAATGGAASALANSIAIRNANYAIADAKRRAGEAATDSARRVEEAERSVARAEKDAERATRATTAARADAARQLDELADRAAGYKTSVEDAALSVEESKQAQEEANARYGEGSLEARRAALNVQQAEERLARVRKEGAQAVTELNVAMSKGIEGSDQVVAAKEAEQAAADRVADARRAEQVAREQADRTARDGAEQVARAVQSLADTQAQQAATAGAAAAKTSTYAAELAKLTPEGRKFVETLIGMKDWSERLGRTAQAETLPGFTRLIDAGRDLEPVLAHGITVVGGAMSDTADKTAALAKSPAFKADLWAAFDNAVPVLDAIGDATVDLTGKWIRFMADGRPAAEGLADMIDRLSAGTGDFLAEATPGMDAYGRVLRTTGDIGRDFLGWLGRLVSLSATEAAPALDRTRDALREVEAFILEVAQTGLPAMVGSFGTVLDMLSGFLALIKPIAGELGGLAGAVIPFVAALKLIDKVTMGGVSGQFDMVKRRISEADSARGRFGNALAGMGGAAFSPFGLAVAGVTTALAIWGDMQQRANELQKKAADGVKAYREELASTGGVLGDNTRKLAEKNLSSLDAYNTDKKLVDVAREHGISLADLTAAYEGNKQKQQEISGALSDQKTKWYEVHRGVGDVVQQVGYWIGASDEGADSAADLEGQLNGLWNEVNKTAESTKTMTYEQGVASGATKKLDEDIKGMADSTADATSRGASLLDFLQRLSGQSPKYEDAVQRINDQMRTLAELFGANIDKTKGFGQELLNASGGIDTSTANGSRLRDIMKSIAENTLGAAMAAYDLARSQGKSVPEAMAAANQVVDDQNGRLRGLADAMGLSAEQMQTLLNKYALTPEQVMSNIGQPGMQNAQAQADSYKRNYLDKIDRNVDTTFGVNTQGAYDSVNRFLRWYYDLITKPLPAPTIDPNGSALPFGDSGAPRRAKGGPVTAGTKYLVGEEGEEFFVPKTDGMIVPAGPTAAYQAGMEHARAMAPAAPTMASVGGRAAPARGADAASAASAGSMATLQIGVEMQQTLAEIRSLATAVVNRPVVLYADGREIATAAERGAAKNIRR